MGAVVTICDDPETREQRLKNKKIEDTIKKDKNKLSSQLKLLMLGPGESGKSTVVKQMRILHTEGFDDIEIEFMKEVIYANIITNMNVILEAMTSYGIHLQGPATPNDVSLIKDVLKEHTETDPISAEVQQALRNLWVDGGVQETYTRRNEYQLSDSTQYFLDDLDRICGEDYRPSQDDVLRARVRTTGIVQIDFTYSARKIRVFDVGGQRTERRKWIHAFDNVDAVLFVAAISEFDQVIAEDGFTNRMVESLRLFDLVCNGLCFNKTTMILFLNKIDLFRKKIEKGTSIKSCFAYYTGGDRDLEASQKFVRNQFLDMNANKDRIVFSHVTCATDTQQIAKIVDNVMDTILANALEGGGMT